MFYFNSGMFKSANKLVKIKMFRKIIFLIGIFKVIVAPAVTLKPALILTPYLSENRLDEARNLSLVDNQLFFNVKSYSGFFTVDKRYNSNIYFWYFPIANRVVEDTPWIIWLQGGPGVSSLVGLFDEMGPFDYNKRNGFRLRETSWCKDYSMVFIDNPVGAGFSFTDHPEGLPRNMEMYTNNLVSALRQLLRLFSELRRAPLYIAGSSYAGRYVPALAAKISEAYSTEFNLQGVILGNPVFDPQSVMDYSAAFYQWGIIDQQGVLAAKPLQDKYKEAIQSSQNELAAELRNELLNQLQDISSQNEMYNILKDNDKDLREFVKAIVEPSVREVLHVGDLDFTFSNGSVYRSLSPDFLHSASPKVEALLDRYKILIYCGQLDLMASCVQSAEERRRSWRWRRRDQFLRAPRLPWWSHGTVAGYVKSGGGLTEVLLRGAGHIAPRDKPAEVQELVSSFIQGQLLNTVPGYQTKPVPEYQDLSVSGAQESSNAGLIASVVLNVALFLSVAGLLLWIFSWKRRNDDLFIPLQEDIFNVT